MLKARSAGAALGVLSAVALSSCTETGVIMPEVGAPPPSLAILDGSSGGSDDFFFLPPLAQGSPTITGEFNPDLLPAMRVCELDMLLGSCVAVPPVVEFAPGSIPTDSGNYQIGWDTDGPETSTIDTNKYYRLEILVADSVMGWIELDPQDPNGPGQSTVDAYAFRLGETIPVKFWLSTETLCEASAYVTECLTGAVIDEAGGRLDLDGEGNKLGVVIFENSLPGDDHPPVTVTIERIDPALFLSATGTECIPFFDAPQFGDCFRITTFPELTEPLDVPALISICLDPFALSGIDLSLEQQEQLTMVRFHDDEWEALPDAPGDCPIQQASLLPEPDNGVLRYAVRGINAVARFVGPRPLAAEDIRLGGFTSSFSRFRYALPGQMSAAQGNGTVLQASDPADVVVAVLVLDHEDIPIEHAVVHFETADGTISGPVGVTDADGIAAVTWSVSMGSPGDKTLRASALGLLAGNLPSHASAFLLTTESIDFTVTVVGPPTAVTQSPTETFDDGVAGEVIGAVSVTLTDAGGNPVAGYAVSWSGDGSVSGGSVTDGSGTATGEWTAGTGAGNQSMTATAGSLSATFTATVGAAAPAQLTVHPYDGSAYIGSSVALGITLQDAFGNPRVGDAVTWTATGGGGSISGGSVTDSDGSASGTWTIGSVPGANTGTVEAGGLDANLTVAGICLDGYGTAAVNGSFGSTEWTCARSQPFQANVSGGKADAVVYWMNDATNLYLAVRVRRSALDKVNSLRFDFDNDGNGLVGVGDDVIGYNGDTRTFFDHWLDQNCANRNQAGCSVADTQVNGSGVAANDGTWTTYELAHPLSSGDPRDFSLESGEVVGHYLTLRVGNGAQGNTQFPGFRQYAFITIVGL